MFRTIKVKLTSNLEPILKTAALYTRACQLALDYGFKKMQQEEGKYGCQEQRDDSLWM